MSVNRAVTNMLTLANELARMAGPKCRETVSAALRRWEEKIRERVRLEMALKLADDSGGGRQVQRVAVSLCDGLPVALLAYEHDLTTELAEIAGMFGPDLLSFSESAAALQQLMDRLGSVGDSWAERAKVERPRIAALENLTAELLELAARATFTDKLKAIDGDVLGAYFPVGKKPKGGGPPVIEIYWAVIGAVAKAIQVDVEGLTLTVLTHELAHAYSHLGADTDGNRWADEAFCQSEVFIAEGIAQYYTEKIVQWFQQRNIASPFNAYTELLKVQSRPYHIHEEWTKKFSPETVRAAMIECRNTQVIWTVDFVRLMDMAKKGRSVLSAHQRTADENSPLSRSMVQATLPWVPVPSAPRRPMGSFPPPQALLILKNPKEFALVDYVNTPAPGRPEFARRFSVAKDIPMDQAVCFFYTRSLDHRAAVSLDSWVELGLPRPVGDPTGKGK
jgi:hypothetical protein